MSQGPNLAYWLIFFPIMCYWNTAICINVLSIVQLLSTVLFITYKVVATESTWSIKLNTLTIWHFTGKVC